MAGVGLLGLALALAGGGRRGARASDAAKTTPPPPAPTPDAGPIFRAAAPPPVSPPVAAGALAIVSPASRADDPRPAGLDAASRPWVMSSTLLPRHGPYSLATAGMPDVVHVPPAAAATIAQRLAPPTLRPLTDAAAMGREIDAALARGRAFMPRQPDGARTWNREQAWAVYGLVALARRWRASLPASARPLALELAYFEGFGRELAEGVRYASSTREGKGDQATAHLERAAAFAAGAWRALEEYGCAIVGAVAAYVVASGSVAAVGGAVAAGAEVAMGAAVAAGPAFVVAAAAMAVYLAVRVAIAALGPSTGGYRAIKLTVKRGDGTPCTPLAVEKWAAAMRGAVLAAGGAK